MTTLVVIGGAILVVAALVAAIYLVHSIEVP